MQNTPTFVLKSFTGISDYEDKGVRGAFKFARGANIRKRSDTLSANQALVSLDDSESPLINQHIYFQVNSSDGDTYLFGTSKIWKQTSAGVLSLVYTDPDGQICGAAEWSHSNGLFYLFWATATKLKSKLITGGEADWSDVNDDIVVGSDTYTYPKTNLTSTLWHTMVVANGALNICNKDKMAFVGFDGSYTNESLQLLPGSVAKTVIDREDFVVIAAGSNTDALDAYLYAWQQGALTYLKKKKIPAKNINALIEGEVMLMQADTDGDIYFSDFVSFLPVTKFPSGGQVNPGGVLVYDKIAYFGVFGSDDASKDGVYSYGRNKKNGIWGMNLEYPITCDEIGSLGIVNGVLQVAYKNGSNYYLYKIDSTTKQTFVYESLDLVAPLTSSPELSTWSSVKLILKKMPASTSLAVKYRMDKVEDNSNGGDSNGWVSAMLEGSSASLSVTGTTQTEFLIGSVGEICEIQITGTPSGNNTPEVIRAEVSLG